MATEPGAHFYGCCCCCRCCCYCCLSLPACKTYVPTKLAGGRKCVRPTVFRLHTLARPSRARDPPPLPPPPYKTANGAERSSWPNETLLISTARDPVWPAGARISSLRTHKRAHKVSTHSHTHARTFFASSGWRSPATQRHPHALEPHTRTHTHTHNTLLRD